MQSAMSFLVDTQNRKRKYIFVYEICETVYHIESSVIDGSQNIAADVFVCRLNDVSNAIKVPHTTS